MAVYVDKVEYKFNNLIMCHMLADTIAELHEFAEKIGLKREWFQLQSRPHYDISKSYRVKAIETGAIEVGRRELAIIMRKQIPVWREELM